jgi:heptosyltransferase-2
MILKIDCIHFEGDRPCAPHKREGVKCDDCRYYQPLKEAVLIVKLDAVGDVLRSTSILGAVRRAYPGCYITWVTRRESVELFANNELVDEVLVYESTEAASDLAVRDFDLVLNLDTAPRSASLAAMARGAVKRGFLLDRKGNVVPANPEAEHWLEMSAFDDVKKANRESYQRIMLSMAKLDAADYPIILRLSEAEQNATRAFSARHRLEGARPVIGLNTGASPRWQYKQWSLEGYRGLISLLIERTKSKIVLYGGPYEVERNRTLATMDAKRIIDATTAGSLRDFFPLVDACDVLVTGDTLALHAATALGKRILALFGPTSLAEIDDYHGRIVKLAAEELDCLCCYKPTCDFAVTCMSSLTPERVYAALAPLIAPA